jgi:hypothetical protein
MINQKINYTMQSSEGEVSAKQRKIITGLAFVRSIAREMSLGRGS